MQPSSSAFRRYAQMCADRRGVEVEHEAEREEFPFRPGQLGEGDVQIEPLDLERRALASSEGRLLQHPAPAFPARHLAGLVQGHCHEPGPERSRVAQDRGVSPQTKPRVLHGVSRAVPVPCDKTASAHEFRVVRGHEPRQRRAIHRERLRHGEQPTWAPAREASRWRS